MARVTLKNVNKIFPNGFQAVHDQNLEIRDGEFMVLVGPSGCAKSTTLNMIAGLESISSGEIWIGDSLVNDLPPKDRDIAMVFQNYALYPHMNVYDNMAFGLKLQKLQREEIDRRVRRAAGILNLEQLLRRRPKSLSGGQKQRVAVGRAIVRQPKVFLMDEPLSNLDAKLRVHMRVEIARLHKQLAATFIYVTHDQVEAMTMGDRITVMREGIIQQVDTPLNLYKSPANRFVAEFIGSPAMNIFRASLAEDEKGRFLQLADGTRLLPSQEKIEAVRNSGCKEVLLGIRPESFSLNPEDVPYPATLKVPIEIVERLGSDLYLYFSLNASQYTARLPGESEIGETGTIRIYADLDKCHLFDSSTERNLCC